MAFQTRQTVYIGILGFMLLVMGIAGFYLFKGISKFGAEERKLVSAGRVLDDLYSRNPFPSDANIAIEQANVDDLAVWYDEIVSHLKTNQVQPMATTPSRFMGFLGEKTRRWADFVKRTGTEVPANFAFGFERYSTGTLPAPEDVPRLMQQLLVVERLFKAMLDSKVSSIHLIKRDEFDSPDPASGGVATDEKGRYLSPFADIRSSRASTQSRSVDDVKNAGLIREGELYGRLHFVLEFRARESSMLGFLDRIAAHDMFIVITSVLVDRTGFKDVVPTVVGQTQGDTAVMMQLEPAQEPNVLTRRKRLVSGVEIEKPFPVKVELDVYRFK